MIWRIHHRVETVSTNLDARDGRPGDVYTADFQSAGRGRLDHVWLSAPGENVMMSAVLDVTDCPPERVATLPLVVGFAVIQALRGRPLPGLSLKWPNDVLVGGRKLAGILCERQGDQVIAGIGVNVCQTRFSAELADKATSLARLGCRCTPGEVRDAILDELGARVAIWREEGLTPFLAGLRAVDYLKGRTIGVRQTDDDADPIRGVCEGIASDGSLIVAGRHVYAGEAHVLLG